MVLMSKLELVIPWWLEMECHPKVLYTGLHVSWGGNMAFAQGCSGLYMYMSHDQSSLCGDYIGVLVKALLGGSEVVLTMTHVTYHRTDDVASIRLRTKVQFPGLLLRNLI